jgi:hypothetical protein
MPALLTIEPNPDFHPATPSEKAAYAFAQTKGRIEMDAVTAKENVRLSQGMYRIAKNDAGPAVPSASIDSMTPQELKEYAAKLGITIRKKRVSKSVLVGLIRETLDDIEVTDDDDEEVDMDSEDE